MRNQRLAGGVLIAVLLAATPGMAYPGVDAGLAAIRAGAYGAAFRDFHSAAKHGSTAADRAMGTRRFCSDICIEAAKWFRKAAAQGDTEAKQHLALLRFPA